MSPEPCFERSEKLWFRAIPGSILPHMEIPLPYCVYVLRSLHDGKFYIGFTEDLARRLAEHNAGESPATAPRRPFTLLFCECFADKAEALTREQYLKTTKGHRALRLMLRSLDSHQISQPLDQATEVENSVPRTLR